MRNILFRGKRKDNGEWVEGALFYAYNTKTAYIIYQSKMTEVFEDGVGGFDALGYEVDVNTVCQYTSLTDKDGTKIWENDIVRVISEDDELFVIHWDKDTARYTIDSDTLSCDFDNFYSYELEVIGNIFDNPELLEVQNGEIN